LQEYVTASRLIVFIRIVIAHFKGGRELYEKRVNANTRLTRKEKDDIIDYMKGVGSVPTPETIGATTPILLERHVYFAYKTISNDIIVVDNPRQKMAQFLTVYMLRTLASFLFHNYGDFGHQAACLHDSSSVISPCSFPENIGVKPHSRSKKNDTISPTQVIPSALGLISLGVVSPLETWRISPIVYMQETGDDSILLDVKHRRIACFNILRNLIEYCELPVLFILFKSIYSRHWSQSPYHSMRVHMPLIIKLIVNGRVVYPSEVGGGKCVFMEISDQNASKFSIKHETGVIRQFFRIC
jgi:hypothetical protein